MIRDAESEAMPGNIDQPARPALYLQSVVIYLSSRLVVAMAIVFACYYVPPNCFNDACAPQSPWTAFLSRWDGVWYANIAASGYRYNGNAVAFYPLYPLLSHGVASVTGLDIRLSLLIVSNIAAIMTVLALVRLLAAHLGDTATLSTIAFMSFFPTSFFLSAAYTESLSLLVSVGVFLLLKSRNIFVPAVLAGLGAATRAVGLVLVFVLIWQIWTRHRENLKVLTLEAAAAAIVGTSGLWLYMIYQWYEFGDAFAFAHVQAVWHGGTTLGQRFFSALTLRPFSLRLESLDDLKELYFLLFMILAIASWWRLPLPLAIFTTGVLLVPYLTMSGGPNGFIGMPRYVIVAFPAFAVLASLCEQRPWLRLAMIGIFSGGLFVYTAKFAQYFWVA
jgi:Mannosyltransferase (PIG-V)